MRKLFGTAGVFASYLACTAFQSVPVAEPPPDAGEDSPTTIEPELDASADADSGVRLVIAQRWSSPNGARFTVTDAGTTITGFGNPHPVLHPQPQPVVPSEDFTVRATVYAPNPCEFGVLARVQSDHSAVVFGSEYGQNATPYLGILPGATYNPQRRASGERYTFEPVRYHLQVRVVGAEANGKLWKEGEPEPSTWVGPVTMPWSTGRGVGFYLYALEPYDVVLERLEILVP